MVARYPGTWIVRGADAGLLRLFPAKGAVTDHIYLVDPLGMSTHRAQNFVLRWR